jgi:hypothetical protein
VRRFAIVCSFSLSHTRHFAANGFYYGAYEAARIAQTKPGQNKSQLASWQVMMAGSAGGLAYWLSVYPVDLVK